MRILLALACCRRTEVVRWHRWRLAGDGGRSARTDRPVPDSERLASGSSTGYRSARTPPAGRARPLLRSAAATPAIPSVRVTKGDQASEAPTLLDTDRSLACKGTARQSGRPRPVLPGKVSLRTRASISERWFPCYVRVRAWSGTVGATLRRKYGPQGSHDPDLLQLPAPPSRTESHSGSAWRRCSRCGASLAEPPAVRSRGGLPAPRPPRRPNSSSASSLPSARAGDSNSSRISPHREGNAFT